MENFFRMFKERLFLAFYDFLDANKQVIGRWYEDLYGKAKKGEAECNTFMKLLGDAMWMFNMVAECGVGAGVGPNHYDLQFLKPGLDEKSSKRILMLISSALCLQQLPQDVMHQEMAIISSTKFSLKLFSEEL